MWIMLHRQIGRRFGVVLHNEKQSGSANKLTASNEVLYVQLERAT